MDKQIKELISKMTLREKLAQLTQVNANLLDEKGGTQITGPESKTIDFTENDKNNVGSVLNFNGIKDAMRIQKEYMSKTANGIPLLFMQDVVHGYKTIYPINLGLACSFDMDLIEELSSMSSKEASLNGVKVTFAPMLDVCRDARWGRVMESCGEDVYLAGEIAKASVKGFQGDLGKYKTAGCFKHFCAYGAAEAGKDYNTVDMSERTLREYYLGGYKSAVDSGIKMAMPSFNIFDGIPMIANKKLTMDVLRKEWGFDGVIISDYCAVWEEITHGYASSQRQAILDAIEAGEDVEMVSTALIAEGEQLVRDGVVKEETIDKSLYRFLKLKKDLGAFDNPFGDMDFEEEEKFCLCEENRKLVRKASDESAVLLKNDGLLPLSEKVGKVAVIGPLANTGELLGNWCCVGDPNKTVTVFDGIKNVVGENNVFYAKGCGIEIDSEDESGFAEAINLARSSDVVLLCLGEASLDSGEGNSKLNLDLPYIQNRLCDEIVKVNPDVAVILFTGRPLSIVRQHKSARAILNMWFPGTEGGNSVADLVFGKVNPSGKLSMTFPFSVGQCPIYYNHYNTGRPRYDDNKRCPYSSAYIDGPNKPLYPFGYGLSYTEFKYSDLKTDKKTMTFGETVKAEVTVENVGNCDGTEVVQLYIRDWSGSTVRPVKELKGFKRIFIRKGEKKHVEFEINEDMLAFYGAELKRKAEKGDFGIYVGGNSDVKECVGIELV